MFDLSRLTPSQRQIIEGALADWKFDPENLRPGLKRETGRSAIPVEFIDLSRYGQATASRAAGDHASEPHDHANGHDHSHDSGDHVHVTDPQTGDVGHGILHRSRVLGLAWYSGKVSIEKTLESDPALAREVFNAEGAHMLDFFWMTDDDRAKIASSLHADGNWQHDDHSWFEERGDQDYYDWPGETFMDLFILAATPDKPSMAMRWTHPVTAKAVEVCRQVLQRGFKSAPGAGTAEAWGAKRSFVYHTYDHIKTLRPDNAPVTWATISEASRSGRRKCQVCTLKERR